MQIANYAEVSKNEYSSTTLTTPIRNFDIRKSFFEKFHCKLDMFVFCVDKFDIFIDKLYLNFLEIFL